MHASTGCIGCRVSGHRVCDLVEGSGSSIKVGDLVEGLGGLSCKSSGRKSRVGTRFTS